MTKQLREVVADALQELLPCPFCGATRPGIALHSTLADRCFRVLCICGAEGGPWGKRDDEEWGTYEEAIAAWNRRATLPTQSAGVEERAREMAYASASDAMDDLEVRIQDYDSELNVAASFTAEVLREIATEFRDGAGLSVKQDHADMLRENADHLDARASIILKRAEIAAALRTPASEGDGGRADLEQFRPAVVNWRNEQRGTIKILSESLSPLGAGAQKLAEGRLKEAERLLAVIDTPPTQQEARAAGCRAKLAPDQWFHFCGETDMGQTLPVLCEACEPGGLKRA